MIDFSGLDFGAVFAVFLKQGEAAARARNPAAVRSQYAPVAHHLETRSMEIAPQEAAAAQAALATFLLTAGDPDGCLQEVGGALECLPLADTEDAEPANSLADLLLNAADHFNSLNRLAEARAAVDLAVSVRLRLRSLLERLGSWSPVYKNDLAGDYLNRGSLLAQQGHLSDALADFDLAVVLCEELRFTLEPTRQWLLNFSDNLAAAYGNRATALTALGRLEESVAAHRSGIAVRECLRAAKSGAGGWTSERENELADAYMNFGAALQKLGGLRDAIESYDLAIKVAGGLRRSLEQSGRWEQQFRIGMARAYSNRASALVALGESTDALPAYDRAIAVLEECRGQSGSDLDLPSSALIGLAGAYSGRGGILSDIDRLEESKAAYGCATAILERLWRDDQSAGAFRASIAYALAETYRGWGRVLSAQSQFQEAAQEHGRAIDVLLQFRGFVNENDWTPEFRVALGKLYSNRGNALKRLGRLGDAEIDLHRAVDCARDARSTVTVEADWAPGLRGSLAMNLMDLANALTDRGRLVEAVAAHNESVDLMKGGEGRDDGGNAPRFRLNRAKALMNRGVALDIRGDSVSAIAVIGDAILVGEELRSLLCSGDRWACEYRDVLAQSYSNRGVALVSQQRFDDAEDDFKSAVGIGCGVRALLEPQGRWPLKYRNDLAVAYLNLGVAIGAQGRREEAFHAYTEAAALNELLPDGVLDEGDVVRITLAANLAALLDFMPKAISWARKNSARMAILLELRPPTQQKRSTLGELHRQFALFHSRWLSWCVRTGQLDLMPEILGIVQGRELAAEVLDGIELEHPETPKEVREFHEARSELRRLSASIEALDSDARATGEGLVAVARPQTADGQTWDRASYIDLESNHRTQSEKISALRHAAAEIPGYQHLETPYQRLEYRSLQGCLAANEGLLLLVNPAEGETGVLLVRRAEAPSWRSLPELPVLAAAVHVFDAVHGGRAAAEPRGASLLLQADAGLRLRGSYRRGRTPEAEVFPGGPGEEHESMEAQRRTLSETLGPFGKRILEAIDQPELFWDNMADIMGHFLWSALAPHLDGLEQLTVIPHGELHLLPLSCGAPESLKLVRYPGLAFFAHRRGLYGSTPAAPDTVAHGVGLIGFDGEGGDIPMVLAEAAALAELHRSHGRTVYHPSDYPHGTKPTGLLHIACHGGKDPQNPERVALYTSKAAKDPVDTRHVLSQDAIVASPIAPLDLYFSACLGGQTVEGLTGTPSGLISACFRRNARWVAGALVSIPDQWATLLALLTHQGLVYDGLALPAALAEGKRRLGAADWYPDTGTRLHAVLAAPLRRLMDDAGRALWDDHFWVYGDPAERLHQFSAVAIPTLLQGWALDDTEVAELHTRLRHHGPESLAEPLGAAMAELWPSRPRIPPQPALGILVHGMVVFG